MTPESGEAGRWFTGSRFEDLGRRVDRRFETTVPKIEEEVKKTISYLNDEVVPRLRQNSSQALYAAAEQLRKLANHLEESGRRRSS